MTPVTSARFAVYLHFSHFDDCVIPETAHTKGHNSDMTWSSITHPVIATHDRLLRRKSRKGCRRDHSAWAALDSAPGTGGRR